LTGGGAERASRLLKKAHLLGPILRMGTPHARALAAAYLGYALRAPPGIWTFVSSLNESGFFSSLLEEY